MIKPPFKLHIGMRIIKTALAVTLCLVIFRLLHRGSPMLAALAAVFCLRENHQTSIEYTRFRMFGTTIGGVVSIFYLFLLERLPQQLWIEAIAIFISIVLIIVICNITKQNVAIVAACSTFFVIVFSLSSHEMVAYAVQRLLDTFIGAAIALAVNHLLPNHHHKPKP